MFFDLHEPFVIFKGTSDSPFVSSLICLPSIIIMMVNPSSILAHIKVKIKIRNVKMYRYIHFCTNN